MNNYNISYFKKKSSNIFYIFPLISVYPFTVRSLPAPYPYPCKPIKKEGTRIFLVPFGLVDKLFFQLIEVVFVLREITKRIF